jgi:RNA polymerase sigma-70 factor (ECF subfamily)
LLYHAVLRYKAEHPKARSAELCGHLRAGWGKTLTTEGVRQLIHRAREKFADVLVEEVSHSLRSFDPEILERELIDLNLLEYCGASLRRWRRTS